MDRNFFIKNFILGIFILILFAGISFAEGVTIITHGWNVSSGAPAWLGSMQNDISQEFLNGEQNFGTISVGGVKNALTVTCSPWNVSLSSSVTGEIIIILDWSTVANHMTSGITAQEVASAIITKITQGQNGERPLAELPIHLIGHSRGGGMVCEIARILGEWGIIVDHLTTLDPHPLTSSDIQPTFPLPSVIDTPVAIYKNVLFADNYLQKITYPMGETINGSYDRQWTTINGGYDNAGSPHNTIADHLNIILAYHASINLNSPLNNGEATLLLTDRTNWFTAYETDGGDAGQKSAFCYSRIANLDDRLSTNQPNGGERPKDGYNDDSLLGGSGSRSSLSWMSPNWPNIITIKAYRGTTLLNSKTESISLGETLNINYVGFDSNSSSDITFYVDQDRNPYNNNNLATIGTKNHSASGSSFFSGTQTWDTAGLNPSGGFYVYGKITDGTNTRYIYISSQFIRLTTNVKNWNLY